MDYLPVEVIGHILSRLGCARDVIVASTTCWKWQEAYRTHLRTLSFRFCDAPIYSLLPVSRLEMLITRTISQTTGLQDLTISMCFNQKFSAVVVIYWLLYTKTTLRRLCINVNAGPWINVVDYLCGFQKLEVLNVANYAIAGVRPNFHRCSSLRSLCLSSVRISALDLTLLLAACPRIEIFELVGPRIETSDAEARVELQSPTLKMAFLTSIHVNKFIIKADNIEDLRLKECGFYLFELKGKGSLKHLKIDNVEVKRLNIGETTAGNLEILDVDDFIVSWPNFYEVISKLSKLRRLRLWRIEARRRSEKIDFGKIAACFPQLSHLSLSYDEEFSFKSGYWMLYYLKESTILENVVHLELRWDDMDTGFWEWAEELLICCPNTTKLIINGEVPDAEDNITSSFNPLMVKFVRKYMHLDVQFEFT